MWYGWEVAPPLSRSTEEVGRERSLSPPCSAPIIQLIEDVQADERRVIRFGRDVFIGHISQQLLEIAALRHGYLFAERAFAEVIFQLHEELCSRLVGEPEVV